MTTVTLYTKHGVLVYRNVTEVHPNGRMISFVTELKERIISTLRYTVIKEDHHAD